MVEKYLTGSISQSLERVRQLRQIVQQQYRREYDGLRQICLRHLDETWTILRRLSEETIVDSALQTPRRVREFKRVVRQLNAVEGVGVFALSRTSEDDDFLNRLVTGVCGEIKFPLVSPTISHISQDYFQTYVEFNLLCMPLIESRFFLHLPDIYHEFCHLFHRVQDIDLPALESYHDAYRRCLFDTVRHFRGELTAAERVRKPAGSRYQLQLWNTCWTKFWMQEFFCDLFGVLVAGPAFAWSHYHLCVKRGGDPFDTPVMLESTHPADDARMRMALMMLKAAGFDKETKLIEDEWQELVGVMGYRPTVEYQQAYPEAVMSAVVSAARRGIKGMGVVAAEPDALQPIIGRLNAAWEEFWRMPENYQEWETEQFETLRASVNSTQ